MIKRFLRLSMAIVSIFVFVVVPQVSAVTQNDIDCANQGSGGGTCFYQEVCADGTVAPDNTSGATGGPIYIMGDSITNIAMPSYKAKFADPWSLTIAGQGSRQIVGGTGTDGITQINKADDKEAIGKAKAIVIALGTNGLQNDSGTTKRQVDRLMNSLKKLNTQNAPVYWVNVFDYGHQADSRTTNRAIDDGVGNDATVIDWYKEAKANADGASFEDGVHPTAQKDIDLLVNKVYDSVTTGSPTAGPARTNGAPSGEIVNSSKTPKNGQSLGGVAGTGFTQAEVDQAKARGHGSFNGGNDFNITTYGPPWDATEGTGITSTGQNLAGPNNSHGRPRYVIAVDPNVIPYGSLVTVWPNAVKWKGAFLAGDTGGAIDGNHVDVYDWSGDATKDVFSKPTGGKVQPYTGSLADTGAEATAATEASPTECCPVDGVNATPGTGSPDGTTFPNLDPSAMARAIDKYIVKVNPRSTMKGLGSTIVATAKNSDINPFLIVNIARKESILGDPGVFNVSRGNNSFGRTAAPGQPSFQGSRAWYKWSSVKASVDYTASENKAAGGSGGDMGGFIKDVYADSIKSNDLVAFFMKYAPPVENETATYIAQVKAWNKELVNMTSDGGASVSAPADASASEDAPSATDACCPPEGSEVTSPAPSTDKPNFIDMSGSPVNGTQMGHGKMTKIDTLLIHYTQYDAEGAKLKKDFISGGKGLGIQFNVGKSGKVYQYFPLKDMQTTYHAIGVNSHAIGIEITGDDGEDLMNNTAQFNSVVQTARYLCDYYNIPCSNPKGDITGSSAADAQGMIGHSETPQNDHSDPDTKVTYPSGGEVSWNLVTKKKWTEADRKDSSKHAYMMKLRKALGYDETPGTSNKAGAVTETSTQGKCAAPPSTTEATNMKKTLTVKTKGKFIKMPSKYSCAGKETTIDSRIAADIAYIATKYNMCADDGLSGGHKSHGAGLGVDMRPRNGNSKEVWKSTVEAAAKDMGWYGDGANDPKGSKPACANYPPGDYGQCMHEVYSDKIPQWVRWLGYNGDYQHGDPWHIYGGNYAHIHIGWDTPNHDGVSRGIIGTPRESVYAFPAPVPDDLKNLVD